MVASNSMAVCSTELSLSLPCIDSDALNPAAIMFTSIAVEDLLQVLKHLC